MQHHSPDPGLHLSLTGFSPEKGIGGVGAQLRVCLFLPDKEARPRQTRKDQGREHERHSERGQHQTYGGSV